MANDECPYRSEFARRHYLRGFAAGYVKGLPEGGEAEAWALAIRKPLHLRVITVPEAAATRLDRCTDLNQFDTWLDRALAARTIDDVFTD
ncbi:hypothetical protein [Nocardia nepalensis]|uniref:hypothetical protein n=1 Tax=Nocardia nepalensis TaxID=3375448 RepID=UPI003B67E6AC